MLPRPSISVTLALASVFLYALGGNEWESVTWVAASKQIAFRNYVDYKSETWSRSACVVQEHMTWG